MFSSILVPLDGSPFAEQALPWALSLARRAGARVELARGHVLYALKDPAAAWLPYDAAEDAEYKRQEQLYLEATAAYLAGVSPVPIGTAVVTGLEADGILGRVRDVGADLVVMTTHARGPVGRLLLGSVATEVVRRATVPVLLIRPRESPPGLLPEPVVEEVLVALDGSPLAELVVGPALDLARLLEAPCTLLRVVDPDGDPKDAREYLRGMARWALDAGVPAEPRVIVAGHAAEAIRASTPPDGLIALATHGRGSLGRMLLGSVADEVIRGVPTPVLVYRPG
jgi:nucleotide-binding universal stress UspA family protein